MSTVTPIEAVVPVSDRSAQRFPKLRDTQLEVVKRFAQNEPRTFAPAEHLYELGDRDVPSWFIVEGSVELFGRDGLEQETALRKLESGQFTGELNQLSGRPT